MHPALDLKKVVFTYIDLFFAETRTARMLQMCENAKELNKKGRF